jgi:hypothetical protein
MLQGITYEMTNSNIHNRDELKPHFLYLFIANLQSTP